MTKPAKPKLLYTREFKPMSTAQFVWIMVWDLVFAIAGVYFFIWCWTTSIPFLGLTVIQSLMLAGVIGTGAGGAINQLIYTVRKYQITMNQEG